MEYDAFKGCSSLKNITFVSPKTTFVNNVFENCNIITHLECDILQAFNVNNKNVEELIVTYSTDSIRRFEFDKLNNLKRLIINSPIESIRSGLFKYCYSINDITIPSSVKIIEDKAFYDCHSLSKITIPSSVTMISKFCFTFCKSLTQIFIPSSVKEIVVRAFGTIYINNTNNF